MSPPCSPPLHYNLMCPYAWQGKGNRSLDPHALCTTLISRTPLISQENLKPHKHSGSVSLSQTTRSLWRQESAQVPARTAQFKCCCCPPPSQDSWSLAAQPVDFPQPGYWGSNPSVVTQMLLAKCLSRSCGSSNFVPTPGLA